MNNATTPLLPDQVSDRPVERRGLTAATLLGSARTTILADVERETA